MDINTYAVESEVEGTHWWFVARRKLLRSIIEELELPSGAAILDVGTSTGTNLRLLRDMGFHNVEGLDLSSEAIRWCVEKGLGVVRQGSVCAMPFPNESFDLVLATDIIEHVDDDLLAMKELRRVTKGTGKILLTVPAFPSLWGLQDEVAHHKRRYRHEELVSRMIAAGLQVRLSFHFNFLLFVPIWVARRIIRMFGIKLKSENQINTPVLNWILTRVFSLDTKLARWLKPPFGVSILVTATRHDTNGQ